MQVSGQGLFSREHLRALVLLIATGIVGYLCYCVIRPLFPSIAWALALAVATHPFHRCVKRWTVRPNFAAGTAVLLVALLIAAPATFVVQNLAREATRAALSLERAFASGTWRAVLKKHPRLSSAEGWIESQLGLAIEEDPSSGDETIQQDDPSSGTRVASRKSYPERTVGFLANGLGNVLTEGIWLGMQVLVTFMTLFFFFRDRAHVLEFLRSLMPLSRPEADEVFSRISDTIHATIYGSVVVALIQGSMGGFMFWCLGLPSPLLWGAVMALLAVVPVLGTFVIWAPTSAYLALEGEWGKALILACWGAIAIGLIDNLLYPFLVGSRIRFHTLLVFFSILGGLGLFGASGVILGPLLLAVADILLDIWRRRMAYHGEIEANSRPGPGLTS